MRNTIALVMVFTCVGLHAVADDRTLVSSDTTRVKSISLEAIKAKYPTNDLSALQYTGFTATGSTNEQIVLSVTYLVVNSGTTEDVENNEHPMTKQKRITYVVTLDNLGNVREVSTGSSISIQSSTRRKSANQPANQPSEGTR